MARFFSDQQTTLVNLILNRIVPASGDLPGAGDLGIADYLDGTVAASPERKRSFTAGLQAVSMVAEARHAAAFETLDTEDQDDVLHTVEADLPEFFGELVRQAYNGYYTHPRVLEGLGLSPQPPQPQGHPLEIGNLDLLERVRARGQAYRTV